MLKGQDCSRTDINAGIPQGFLLGPLQFLICINDLTDDLSSKAKLFTDDTSLFFVVQNVNISVNEQNNNLIKTNRWDHQCNMSFNTDLNKETREWKFSRKINKEDHSPPPPRPPLPGF